MDWLDSYLNELSNPGIKYYFPPDPPANGKGAKQRLLFDAVASSEAEMRYILEQAEVEGSEYFGGGGNSSWELGYRVLHYSPSTQNLTWYTQSNFVGLPSTISLDAFKRINPRLVKSLRVASPSLIADTITNLQLYTNLDTVDFSYQQPQFIQEALDSKYGLASVTLVGNNNSKLGYVNYKGLNNNSRLRYLDLTGNVKLTNIKVTNSPGFNNLFYNFCPNVSSLDLSYCGFQSDASLQNDGNKIKEFILDGNPLYDAFYPQYIANSNLCEYLSIRNGGQNIGSMVNIPMPIYKADFTGGLSACTRVEGWFNGTLREVLLGDIGRYVPAYLTFANSPNLTAIDFSGAQQNISPSKYNFSNLDCAGTNIPFLNLAGLRFSSDVNIRGIGNANIDNCYFAAYLANGYNSYAYKDMEFNGVSATDWELYNNPNVYSYTFNKCYITNVVTTDLNTRLRSVTINNTNPAASFSFSGNPALSAFSCTGTPLAMVYLNSVNINKPSIRLTDFNTKGLSYNSNGVTNADFTGFQGTFLSLDGNPLSSIVNTGSGSLIDGSFNCSYTNLTAYNTTSFKLTATALNLSHNSFLSSVNLTGDFSAFSSYSINSNPVLKQLLLRNPCILNTFSGSSNSLNTLNLSAVSASGGINISYNALTALNLSYANCSAGSISFNNNALSSLSVGIISAFGDFNPSNNWLSGFDGFPTGYVGGEINFSNNRPRISVANLSAVYVNSFRCNTNLSSLSAGNFSASTVALGNAGLSSIGLGTNAFNNCTRLDLINNNLNTTNLSAVLAKLNANGLSNGTVTFNGGTNALASTMPGVVSSLQGKNWLVVDSAYNLVLNPGFETGDLTNWTNENGVFAVTSDLPHTGTYSVVFNSTSSDTLYSDQMSIPQNAVLTFWMYVAASDPEANGYVGFQNGNTVDISSYLQNGTSGWIQLSVNSGESGAYDNISVYIDDSPNATGLTVYFDDFKVTYNAI